MLLPHNRRYPGVCPVERRKTNMLTTAFVIVVLMLAIWLVIAHFFGAKNALIAFGSICVSGAIIMGFAIREAKTDPEDSKQDPH